MSIKMYAPKNYDSLLETLRLKTENTMFIAGGTDIIVGINEGKYKPDAIIDVSHLSDYKYIRLLEDKIEIGALTTFSDLQYSQVILDHVRALSVAASMVGSPQIRNAGTLGGNIANASAAADTSTVMIGLDADVKVLNSKGQVRSLKVDDLVIRPNTTSLEVDEMIIGFVIDIPKHMHSGFAKVGSRTGVTISKMNACIFVQEENECVKDIRIALGAVGLKPFRHKDEKSLVGTPIKDLQDALQEKFTQAVDDSIRTRKSWSYKRVAITGLAVDVYENYIRNK
ncbi:hypothetical protein EZV73_01100 [Acidaminobacter sp. JC074]|uniref:FAD binding domain-containing protein n=1 Tax=Acidaminobacter sp. JC074 TaxID=2530199 RepID=UPI001F0D206B|nr:FAD binding domain-containing protein [Acidaminobacter sp. JC074]MCH4886139.1 hypothetical protein [Acidaminobacter sp. JC074]